ncbi:ESPR-type extended signal peptide-containing protein [uncultured Veillonella sp.]|uniref:ESPR-type extended signal peptide-containing protein n=1 Tax=uncultured Veillonella sp. TaxID=159268 RepID=UPI00266C2132|nr:ESPR-type extended signal peptide-containing protein [uncultured Veillonella sp.]
MNKIFKVVWSKTKECYVVVSEVAKNNGGKKKVLATVFAALVATGSMVPDYVDAANNTSGGGVSTADASIAIGSGWGNSAYANNNFSIAIGDQTHANGKAAIALGRQAKTDGEEASIAIGNETEATAKDSTAVGSGSKSSGEYAAALGFQTKATANYATAIGSGARGYAEDSQAIGREAETSAGATRAIAIGTLSKSSGNYATSLGSSAEATAERAIAVGYKSKAEAERAISVGNLANATKNDSIAVGNNSAASGLNASAVGKNSKASGQSAAAFGDTAQATNTNATAVGNQANASNTNTTAIGNQTVASGGNATAVGHLSQATADGATAIGTNNKAGYEGTAVGLSNTVTGRTSAAFGRSNTVSGKESLAAGVRSTASGEHNVAIGYQAATDGKATVAIGEGSKADIADGVALGSNSATTAAAGIQGFNPADSRTNTYGGLSGTAQTSTLGAVAVGNGATATRQITGLAAGKENTDAVNVAQLRSVNLKYAGNSGNSDVLLDNGTLNIKGEGLLSTTADGTGITVKLTKGDDIAKDNGKAKEPTNNGVATTQNVVQAINNSYWKATAGGNTDGTPAVGNVKPGTQVTYSAGDNLKVKQTINATTGDQEYKYSLNPVLTGITSIANTTTGPKMTFGGNSINITGGSLDMGTNKITNLAPGTADNDAVNVKQLKDTELHITPGTYTPDANKKVKLTYTDGNNTVVTGKEAVIDLSGLATGGTASTEKVKKAANGANDTNIAEVNPQTGDTYGAAGATYEVSVSRNAVKDAAREAVTVNNGGTTTGGTYTADTNNPISVTAVPDNTNHNTTYAVTFDGNKAAKQIPLTYKATNGTITTADQTVKLDKGLNFTGGDYTTASVGADGKVTFDVNLGTAPTVTDGKPGVPGQAGAAGKDGIATVKTVVDTINNSGWKANAKANGGTLVGNSTATVVKPGDQVNFAAGKNLTVKQDLTGEHTYTYSLNKDIDLTNAGSLTVGDTTVNNGGITIKAPTPAAGTTATTTDVKLTNTGLDNGGNKIVNVAEGTADTDAVNVKQLKDAKTVLADGKNTKKSGTGTATDPYKVNVEGDLTGISSITNGGTNNGKISFGPNKTVTVDGDHSITLNASTGKIGGLQNLTFDPTNFTSGQAATEDQLKSVHDTLKASELHIAPTESNRTGEHIAGAATSNTAAGAAANAYKYDATTKQVVLEYNDGTGANKTGTKAVIDFSALNTGGTTASTWTAKTSAENTTAGSEVGKHAGDTSQVIGNQNSVDFQAGKNMTVKQTNDGNGNTTINYALDKNLDVESVHVGKDGKDGKIGIDGKDGVDGLDGTNRVDIHVEKGAKGVDGTDGHDGVNGHNGKDGMTRIVYEDKGGKQEVATLNDGMKYAGDDAQGTDKTKVIAKKLNETLDIIGGANKADLTTDNIGVNNDGNGKLLVQLSKNLKGINTIKNGNTTITLNDAPSTTTPAVTITGGNLSLGDGTTNNKIVNVAPGTDDTDAVNVKQLKDAKTVLADGKNTKKSGTGTAADPYKVNVEGDLTEITSITNKADASGNNAGKITFSPNQTVTVSGDHNISLNGKTGDITGLTNTTIPTTAGSDFATKGRAATEEQLKIVNDKFNNKINLGADGSTETTKLALDNNGGIKFNIKGDGSGASGANQYISTTASGSDIKVDLTDDAKAKLNKSYDVKSTDKSVTVSSTTTNGVTTFDLKVAPAAGTTSTWDIKSSADTANGGATATGHEVNAKTIANTNSVEMIAGKNLTVKQTSDTNGAKVEFALSDEIAVGKDGANGVDGKIGVNGKDGASVVINGKDGSIGLTGPQGATGAPGTSATLKVKDGVPGVDGAPGTNLTRIVYTDKNNVEHEVATHDDGMKFAGDDGQANQATNANVIKKHLNNVVDIIGGATKTDLTTNNIGVNNDGNGKLLVQLSKNLNGINTIKNGNTTITLNDAPGGATNTPAVTISGGNLSVDGNKVTNVDDGTDNNDAVNVKQLKAAKTEVKAGKNVVVTSETSTTDGHTTYTVNASTPAVYTKPDGTKLVKQPDGTFKDENGNAYTGSVIASFEDGTGATTGGNMIVNNIGSAIKGLGSTGDNYLTKLDLANTATPNAAVNVSDLKNTADALKSNELHIRPTTSGRTGETVNQGAAGTAESYKYDATTKSVTLKYNDGTGAGVTGTEAKIDLSDLANQITSGYTFKANATANGGTVANDATTPAVATTVENGGTINYAAGKNLTVKQDINATAKTHTYTYSLNKDLTNLDKVVVNGENGTNGKDGVTIIGPQGATGATGMPGTNGIDGKVGIAGKDGKDAVSISGKDGIGTIGLTGPQGPAGADGRGVDITTDHGTQTLNKPEANNGGKSERIVYVPKDKDGNPLKDDAGNTIKREVATMDDGLKFAGDDGQANQATNANVIKKQLNNVVDIIGGATKADLTTNNIGVNNDGNGKLLVQLSKNLNGINTIKNGGTTITLNDTPGGTNNTPAVTISGGNLSMGDSTTKNKIVNLAPGTDDNDAVNVKQLKDAKTVLADGKNTKKSGTGTATDPYKVNVEGDLTEITSITNKADASGNAGKITFSPNQTITVDGDHSITLNASTGKIGGLQNKTFDPTNFTSGQAATEDQLKSVHDTLKANERHIAPTTVATGSTETKGGTFNAAGTANVYKYDAASKTVTLTYNDGNGNAVTDTKAVIDLSNLSTGGTGASSWNVKSSANTTDGGAVGATHDATAQNIANGKTVEFQSGKNLVVNQTNDTTNGNATVEFSLSDNITVGKDGANGKNGSVGAKGADGSAVVMNGKDGSIGLNGTNGANGISIKGKDGANGVGIDGKDGVTRIVYTEKVPDPANPGTTKEVTHEVATMDDGLKFTGNNTGTVNKHKLGSLVKVQGEGVSATDEAAFVSASGNIAVTAENNDTLTIRLNKNLKGLNSIQLGGNTIQSNGDNITFTTNGGTTKTVATTDQLWTIQANGTDVPAKSGKVNLVAGDHITITPDATNGKMTISATGFGSMDGFNVKTSAESATVGTHAGDTTENIKNGKTVDMQAGKNLVVTQTNDGNGNTTVNYALNKDVDLGTNGSLKTGDTTINNDGFKNGNTTVGGNGMTIKDPTDPTKTVSLTKDGLNNGGNQITNVASGGNVDTNAANIGDIKRLAKDTRIKDGTYTVDNNGTVELTYVDGAGNQVKDASGNAITAKITGLTTLDSTRVKVAVNETGSGKAVGSKAAVKVTKGTEFVAGDNLIVERKANAGTDVDNSVVYSLNKDLKGIETIKNGNTTITLHNNPTTATDPTAVTITGGNINMGGNRIVNVAPAKDGTDAVNLDQLKAARTKVTSNDGTVSVNRSENTTTGEITYDLHVTPGQSPDLNRVNNRIDQLGEEIGRVGAQGAALSALKPIQYDPLEPTQIMAGYGNYRGNSAVALGVAHYKNESTLIHGGVSWAGGSSHMMANAGVTWKVGNRDSEAAVADRYRKGPISSAYAMQQEMAAMKAQNAGLKGEVSDLKAENEQMKAQIAAMMAKLGL